MTAGGGRRRHRPTSGFVVEAEHGHRLHQVAGLLLQPFGGGGAQLHQGRVLLHDLVHLGDGFADLADGAALGQVVHFAGDHGKAAALFAGTRGVHRRIPGQDVGLEGDAVDGVDECRRTSSSCR